MIPELNEIGEDELFTTWMDNVAQMNGASTQYQKLEFFNKMLGYTFSTNRVTENIRYFNNLENVCRAEKDSKLFPNLNDILRKHTDLYAMAPFQPKGEQARRFEYNLREQSRKNKIIGPFSKSPGFKICPICAMEDEKKYSRKIIHVPHQLNVKACWKHGCLLQDIDEETEEAVTASEQEIEKANFMHNLYGNPAVNYFEQTADAINEKLSDLGMSFEEGLQEATDKGYIGQDPQKLQFMKKHFVRTTEEFYDAYLGMLAWLFGTADNFKKALQPWNLLGEYDKNDFELINCDGLLGKFKCRDCGDIFYMHPDAAKYGSPCPNCSRNMSRVQIYKRYADFLDDGEYDVYEKDGRIHVIHKECGNDVTLRFPLNVWRRTKCRTCQRNARHKKHVGENNRNANGRLMTITDYRSSGDVTVQFEDGPACSTTYDNFLKGWVKCRLDIPLEEQRVGERQINTQGLEMKICRYNSYKDLDVRFKNNVVVKHRTYEEFKLGLIRNPKKLVGEKRINEQGIGMEVIDYKNCHSFQVRFDTGDVITATSVKSFMDGKTKCPNGDKISRIGEKEKNRQGIEMEIIAYRTAEDMDVKFETGYVAKGVSYSHFKKGAIGCLGWYSFLKVGERNINKQGIGMEIIACRNARDMDVRFDTGTVVKNKRYSRFKDGSIRCPETV